MGRINDNVVERLKYSLIVDVYSKRTKKNKRLGQSIDRLTIESIHVIIEILKLIT